MILRPYIKGQLKHKIDLYMSIYGHGKEIYQRLYYLMKFCEVVHRIL